MIKSSVISILKSFSDEELFRFEEFLRSPFHNKNEKVVQLYLFLKNFHPDFKDLNLTKENIFKKIFGKALYGEFHIRNLLSDLNLLAEKFLSYINLHNNFTQEKLLIEELNRRDIKDLMIKKINRLEKLINSGKIIDHDYYANRSFIFEAKSFLIVDKTLTDNFRAEQMSNAIKLFMINMMEFYFYLIVEEQRVRIKHNFDYLQLILDYCGRNPEVLKESPLLNIYHSLLLSFFEIEKSEAHYTKARILFKQKFSFLTKVDRKNIYSVLQTYCINKIDSGESSYNKELLDLLLEMLKFNVTSHKENEMINLNLYRNILILCVTLKEINLLKRFIKKYSLLTDAESRESISAYSLAHIDFLQKNFESCLENCNKINFRELLFTTGENLYFKNDIKKLTLISLFEMDSFESALSQIDANKHFINNSKLIKEEQRTKNMNFLNYVNYLIKLKLNFDEYRYITLRKDVLNSKELINRDWILEKLDMMAAEQKLKN